MKISPVSPAGSASPARASGKAENPILGAYTKHAGQENVEPQFLPGMMYQNGPGVAAGISQSAK
ncbi:MAG: hypothetical protein GY899_00110 [Verrucomicrobiaceae bacterium]|nr:hypothetical protein [Verrucomicrobiaceae bacterium]